MAKPTIFISYSREDEVWKNEVVEQIGVLEFALDPWHDGRIGGSQDWQAEIEKAIERAAVAVLLVTASFLVSEFVRDEEIPRLRARQKRGLLAIYPIIVMPCSWRRVPWLAGIEVQPKDGRALLLRDDGTAASKPEIARDLAEIVDEVADLALKGLAGAELPSLGIDAGETPGAVVIASPELIAVAQSATHSDAAVRQITDSAVDPGTEDLLSQFGTAFREAGETIALITGYKELHDELHTFEMDTFAGIVNEYNRVEDAQARERLALYAGELQATVHQVRAIAKDLPARPGGVSWIEKLERAHALLFEAIRDGKQNPATTALTLLNGVLDSQPGLLNEQIVVHTSALDFDPVQTALNAVRKRLASRQALSPARLTQLGMRIEAMSRLEGDFRAVVQKHDAWQQVEHGLRTIETTIAASFAQLEFLWPSLRTDATPLFTGMPEQWALDLEDACTALDAAVAACDPQRAVEARKRFRQFRRLCSKRFFEIDEELRAACRELSRVGESLQLLLRMLDSSEP